MCNLLMGYEIFGGSPLVLEGTGNPTSPGFGESSHVPQGKVLAID